LSQETIGQSPPIIEPEYVEPPAALTVPIVTEMDAKKALDALAWKIGQQAVLHLRQMYPDALKAVPSTCSVSLRNTIRNAVNGELWPLIRNMVAKANSIGPTPESK
jgi:hypothetical protein